MVIYEQTLFSERFKDDVKKYRPTLSAVSGSRLNDIKEGDILETYTMKMSPRVIALRP